MKKLFIMLGVFFILLVILCTLVFVFFLYDPNQYRSEIERYIQNRFNLKAQLGHISMHWGLDLGIRIEDLELLDPETHELMLRTKNVTLGADVRDMIRREFVLKSLNFWGLEVFLIREKDGRWNWQIEKDDFWAETTLNGSPEPAAKLETVEEKQPAGEKEAGKAWQFFVRDLQVHQGTFHFVDVMADPPLAVNFYQVEIHMTQSDSKAPLQITADASMTEQSIPNLMLEAIYDPYFDFISFQMTYEQDTLMLKGQLRPLAKNPVFESKITLRDFDLESVTPFLWKDRPYLSGSLTADLSGKGEGIDIDALKENLALKGVIEVRRGALKNINLVNRALKKLAPIRGIDTFLEGEIQQPWKVLLKGPDTPFESLQVDLQVFEGQLYADDIKLKHAEYELEGNGTVELQTANARFSTRLILLNKAADYLSGQIKELESLKDERGRIVVPFSLQGSLEDAELQPDLPYIAGNLIKWHGQEMINKGIEKLHEIFGEKNE